MSISRFEEGTCLYYAEQTAKIIFGDNLTSAFIKLSGVLLLITGVGLLTASYMYGLPLHIPSYSAFGVGGGVFVMGYGLPIAETCCKAFCRQVMENVRNAQAMEEQIARRGGR